MRDYASLGATSNGSKTNKKSVFLSPFFLPNKNLSVEFKVRIDCLDLLDGSTTTSKRCELESTPTRFHIFSHAHTKLDSNSPVVAILCSLHSQDLRPNHRLCYKMLLLL